MSLRNGLVAAMAALCLFACGGGGGGGDGGGGGGSHSGGSSSPPPTAEPPISALKVVGDGLSDSGTFGIKFTVQGKPAYPIWTDRIAAALALPSPCPRYVGRPGGSPALNPAATACTSHAVAGSSINPPMTQFDTQPLSIVQQLTDMRTAGSFGPDEVLLVNGGGNDLLDLAWAFIGAAYDGGASFADLTHELASPGEVAGLTRPQVGGVYAVKLANLLADTVMAQALEHGARRVAVLTVPDVSVTPKFREWQVWMARFNASGAAELKVHVGEWVAAFNAQLKARFAGHSRVVVVDFHAELNEWLTHPARYGFTNTTTPACPVLGVGPIPSYDISLCTDAALSAAPPAGETSPWWKSYVFADNLHGTPRTHELMGEFVVRALEAKGWK